MLHVLKSVIGATVPNGDIWSVIREFGVENAGKREGWTVDQWRRFCEAFERTRGERSQIMAFALKENYFLAKEYLEAGRGMKINQALFDRKRALDAKEQASIFSAPLPKLADGPRRKRVDENAA